jgi:serine/threonine-protein kinase
MLTYEDDRLGIIIQYPSNWEKILHLDGFVTFIALKESDSSTYPAGIGLRVEELSSRSVSLEEITRVQIENLTQNYPDLDLVESSATTIEGNPAHKIEFTPTDDKEEKRKAMQIWTLKDDKAYLFTYKADPKKYSAYLQTIQDMIKSFKIIE